MLEVYHEDSVKGSNKQDAFQSQWDNKEPESTNNCFPFFSSCPHSLPLPLEI